MPKVIAIEEAKKVVAFNDCDFMEKRKNKNGINIFQKGNKKYYIKLKNGVPVSLSRKEIAEIFKKGGV